MAIKRLSLDPAPPVRFQAAALLTMLYENNPQFMWDLFERMSRGEESRGVLKALLGYSLIRIAPHHPDQATFFAEVIYERVRDGVGAKEVRKICTSIFTGLYVWHGHEKCATRVFAIADQAIAQPDVVQNMVFELRSALTAGPVKPPDPKSEMTRRRAFDLLMRILRSVREELNRLELEYRGVAFDAQPQEAQDRTKHSLHLISWIAKQLYFASGAFNAKRNSSDASEAPPLGPPEKRRFLEEAGPILDELSDIGVPRITHDLVQTLEHLIEYDPAGVFLRIGRVVRAGQEGNYQYEKMASDVMVRVVERFLAEYRTLLREREDCRRTLIEILDIFVEVGWPNARRLAYRTEEIFR